MSDSKDNKLLTSNEIAPLITERAAQQYAQQSSLSSQNQCRERVFMSFLFLMITSIPALLVGCTLGFPSAALLDLQELEKRQNYKLDIVLSDVFGALAPVGAILGGPVAGWFADYLGRKIALLLVAIPYLCGYLMITYAHFICDPTGFKTVLFLGRFFTGFGLGWSCLASPVYAAEIASSRYRGIFTSCFQLFLSLGLVVVYFLGSFHNFYYYDVSLVLVGIIAFYEVWVLFICETPRWLLAHGYRSKAISTLKLLRGQSFDVTLEISSIENKLLLTHSLKLFHLLKLFAKKEVYAPLLIVIFVMFFNQIGGLNARTAYSAEIFEEANVHNPKATAAYAVGGSGVILTTLSLFIVDRFGRKVLLLISGIGMLLGTVSLGTYFYITRCGTNGNLSASTSLESSYTMCNTHIAPLAIVSIMLFSSAYSIGWGPVAFVLMGELIPLRVRGLGSGIATLVNWSTAAIVAGFYLFYAEKVGAYFAWWTFSCFNLAAVIFVIIFVFETKGKSLEEISARFQKK